MPDRRLRSTITDNLCRAHQWSAAYCRGQNPWWRAGVVAWLVYVSARHSVDPAYVSPFYWLNLPIHEAGHFIFSLQPWTFLAVAAGTLFQLLAPVAAAVNFIRQRDYFALTVCGVWLATNLFYIAWYMADARSQIHPGYRPFGIDADIHDWNYMLSAVGMLSWDRALSHVFSGLAISCVWASVLVGVYLVSLMVRHAFAPRATT